MKKNISLIFILVSIILSPHVSAQNQEIIVTAIGEGDHQYEDIQYRGINVNQLVDFSNLLRVYINKGSVVMVDNNPVNFDSTGVRIKKFLMANVIGKYGKINTENIDSASCELQLLIRKSSFTKSEDYRTFMSMVNESIWGLQRYYSNLVYNQEYPDLSQSQKDKINKLVPLINLLAQDNTD